MATNEDQLGSIKTPSDLLQILRYELNFLEQGGYNKEQGGCPPKVPFQGSHTCLNFEKPIHPHTCRECPLFNFVPEGARTENIPCHQISLAHGQTVATLMALNDKSKLYKAISDWLRAEITKLEAQEQ